MKKKFSDGKDYQKGLEVSNELLRNEPRKKVYNKENGEEGASARGGTSDRKSTFPPSHGPRQHNQSVDSPSQ